MSGFHITAIVDLPKQVVLEEGEHRRRLAGKMGFDNEGGCWYLVVVVERSKIDRGDGVRFSKITRLEFEGWQRAPSLPFNEQPAPDLQAPIFPPIPVGDAEETEK